VLFVLKTSFSGSKSGTEKGNRFIFESGHSAEFGYDEAKRLSFLVKDFQHQAIAFEEAGFNAKNRGQNTVFANILIKYATEFKGSDSLIVDRSLIGFRSAVGVAVLILKVLE
jgi:hypothetical protein